MLEVIDNPTAQRRTSNADRELAINIDPKYERWRLPGQFNLEACRRANNAGGLLARRCRIIVAVTECRRLQPRQLGQEAVAVCYISHCTLIPQAFLSRRSTCRLACHTHIPDSSKGSLRLMYSRHISSRTVSKLRIRDLEYVMYMFTGRRPPL